MAVWFLRGVRRGIVTTRYPVVTDDWATKLPTPPSFDVRRLTTPVVDGLVESCPGNALHREGLEMIFDVGRCSACGRCAAAYPDVAQPSHAFELATTSRGRLLKRIPIRGDSEST